MLHRSSKSYRKNIQVADKKIIYADGLLLSGFYDKVLFIYCSNSIIN